MWIITVTVTFVSALIGVDIPASLQEGPLIMRDEFRNPLRYPDLVTCKTNAERLIQRITILEYHAHGTDGLTVSYTCSIEERDL